MNRGHRHGAGSGCLGTMEVKSKFGAEFRRFSLERSKPGKFEEFYGLLQHVHKIPNVDVLVGYADIHGDLLPINNDDNYHKAVSTANPLLRIFIQKKERCDRKSVALESEKHSPFLVATKVTLVVKNPPADATDMNWIPGSGRSPGGGNGNPLQYSCLENPVDRGAWRATIHGATKSRSRL